MQWMLRDQTINASCGQSHVNGTSNKTMSVFCINICVIFLLHSLMVGSFCSLGMNGETLDKITL